MTGALILALLALLSVVLLLWQTWAGWRFPLHRRASGPAFVPAVTLLKPVKGCDAATEDCLRSWLRQDYAGPVQVLFGVASTDDPACPVIRQLLQEYPERDAQLVVCSESRGANAKVSTLIQLERLARHDVVVISDADVSVPPDLLANVVEPLRETGMGLVTCLYRMANPTTLAMRWEALAMNADFWSQVLQGQSLRPLDYALGAVMATTRTQLQKIGSLAVLADYLADDYHLGNLIARSGAKVVLCPVVVECWSKPMDWREVWHHQLRWGCTIRNCKPWPYALSVLSNATVWPLFWLVANPVPEVLVGVLACLFTRIAAAQALQHRFTQSTDHLQYGWLIPVKDLLQFGLWVVSLAGRQVQWHGQKYRLDRDGKLQKVAPDLAGTGGTPVSES